MASTAGSEIGESPETPDGLRDRSTDDVTDDRGHDDDDVLAQAGSSCAEDLSDQQLARRRGGDQELHHPARLLLGHALRDPVAIREDGHEGEDHDGIGEDVGASEVLVVAGVIGIDRHRDEGGRGEDLGGLVRSHALLAQAIRDGDLLRRRVDLLSRLVRRAGAAEELEFDVPVLRARDRQQRVVGAVAHRLCGSLGIVLEDDAGLIAATALGWRQCALDDRHRIDRQVAGLVDDDDRRRVRDAGRGEDRRHQGEPDHRHREKCGGDDEGAAADADEVFAAGDVEEVREEAPHSAAPLAVVARCCSSSSTARRPTCSMKISSRLGSAISKRRTRNPRSRAARRIVSGSRSAGTRSST